MTTATHAFPSTDPRLDWRPEHDPRSLNFLAASVLPAVVEERPRTWPTGPTIDQGREGACVGFGWTGELMASPRPHRTLVDHANAYAQGVFVEARRDHDEWAGENYSGTSVLAGAKTVQRRGYVPEYRWATSVEQIRGAVTLEGPVVIGVPWLSGMYQTRPSGLVTVEGDVVGGHCLLLTGYHPGMRIRGEDYHARHRVFRWRNSWGTGYGLGGDGFIRYEDLRDLLAQWGEACVPVGRRLVRF